MTVLSIVLKSGLFSSNTQLGITGSFSLGCKTVNTVRAIVAFNLNAFKTFGLSGLTGSSMC